MRARVVVTYVACSVAWGSTWIVVAAGLRDLPPLLFAGLRMVLAGALLAPFAAREASRVALATWPRLFALGLLQIAVPYGLLFAAQQSTPSSLAAVLFATFPVWVALLARAVLGEALTPARLAAAALGFAGVGVLEAPHLGAVAATGPLALASLLIVLASLSAAAANVTVKRWALGQASPLVLTSAQALTSGVVLLAASALLERGRPAAFTPASLSALGYLAVVGTVVTYFCLYWLIARVPLAVVGTLPLTETGVAVALGALVGGERVGLPLAVGGAMVLAAAALAGLSPAPAARAQPSTANLGASAQSPSRS